VGGACRSASAGSIGLALDKGLASLAWARRCHFAQSNCGISYSSLQAAHRRSHLRPRRVPPVFLGAATSSSGRQTV